MKYAYSQEFLRCCKHALGNLTIAEMPYPKSILWSSTMLYPTGKLLHNFLGQPEGYFQRFVRRRKLDLAKLLASFSLGGQIFGRYMAFNLRTRIYWRSYVFFSCKVHGCPSMIGQ